MSRPNDGTEHNSTGNCNNWVFDGFGYPMMSLYTLEFSSTVLCGNQAGRHVGTGFERRLISHDATKAEQIDRVVAMVVSIDHLAEE